jgi:hypothetical protein
LLARDLTENAVDLASSDPRTDIVKGMTQSYI